MYSVQLESHIDQDGHLTLQLPEEWAETDVNVVLVVEKKQVLTEVTANLATAFELLSDMPDDFMQERRQDSLPQAREALL